METAPRRATNANDRRCDGAYTKQFRSCFLRRLASVCGTVRHVGFHRIVGGQTISVVSIFDDEDVRDSFQRTDFKLMRAAFSTQTLWDTLMERSTTRFDREGTERCVRLAGRQRTMRIDLRELQMVPSSPNTQQGRQPRHRTTTTRRSNDESMCQLWQHIRRSSHHTESTRGPEARGGQKAVTGCEISQSISRNFRAQEFGDLQTYCAHARLTHLPFPAPTI